MKPNFAYLASAGSMIALALASPAFGQSRVIASPNTTTAPGAQSVTLNGTTFVNQGVVGVGRLDSATRDFRGETLGSFSGMALDLRNWRRNADGSYTGVLWTLPDRGPNSVGPFAGTTDYRNRVHISNLSFTPNVSTTVLPQSPASQNQLTITPTGGFLLNDSTGLNFTGRDPESNVINRNGILLPSPAAGEGAGRISLDSEAIAFRRDGSFYIADEYGANIYYFSATGRQLGTINPIPAILPRNATGTVDFNSSVAPVTGRRNNQGLEAVGVTPRGNRLVTVLQSATVQDTNGTNQQTRNNTRILVYDIGTNATPTNPIGHFVLQLPVFNSTGTGSPNRTAAQSELLALNDNQFLILSRDGNGRGSGSTAPIVFKSILLVDTTGATNLAGTQFETGVTPIANNGTLVSGIVPVAQVEVVNLLNTVQLNRFGLNLSTNPSNTTSFSEKFEALGLAPVLEEGAPQDFFLFVGNDNDFQTQTGFVNGQPFDASLSGAGGTGGNDNLILVYRLSLPTYVDPLALESLETGAPRLLVAGRTAATRLGEIGAEHALNWLSSLRTTSESGYGEGLRLWLRGGFSRAQGYARGISNYRGDGLGLTGGIDYGSGPFRLGVSFGWQEVNGGFGLGSALDGSANSVGIYAGYGSKSGLYAQAAFNKTIKLEFDNIVRPAAYSLTARGSTDGSSSTASGEIGWSVPVGKFHIGPFALFDYSRTDLNGFTETGASLGNVRYNTLAYNRLRATAGGEVRGKLGQYLFPSLRVGYSFEKETGDTRASASLASAQHVNGTALLVLPNSERNSVTASGRIDGIVGNLIASIGAEGRFGRGADEARVNVGVGIKF